MGDLRLALARLCSGLAFAFCRRGSNDFVVGILILTLQSCWSFLLRWRWRRILHHLHIRIRLGFLHRWWCLRSPILRHRNNLVVVISVIIFVVRCRFFDDRCLWPRSRTASSGCDGGGGGFARCFGGSGSCFFIWHEIVVATRVVTEPSTSAFAGPATDRLARLERCLFPFDFLAARVDDTLVFPFCARFLFRVLAAMHTEK